MYKVQSNWQFCAYTIRRDNVNVYIPTSWIRRLYSVGRIYNSKLAQTNSRSKDIIIMKTWRLLFLCESIYIQLSFVLSVFFFFFFFSFCVKLEEIKYQNLLIIIYILFLFCFRHFNRETRCEYCIDHHHLRGRQQERRIIAYIIFIKCAKLPSNFNKIYLCLQVNIKRLLCNTYII